MIGLDEVHDVLLDIANTSSTNAKFDKLSNYLKRIMWLEKTIEFALNPYKHYNTSKVEFIRQRRFDIIQFSKDFGTVMIFDYLTYLSKKRGASDYEKHELDQRASMSKKTADVVNKIVKKDLRCGISITTAKKLIPDLPTYEVMKAQGDNPFPGKNWDKFVKLCGGFKKIAWAVKVDGYRVSYTTVFKDGTVEHLSTSGKPYDNFSVFDDEMAILAKNIHNDYGLEYPMKFDSEAVPNDGDFQSMQKYARRIYNVDPEVYRLLVWDVIAPIPYHDRYKMLDCLITTSGIKYDFLDKVYNNKKTKVFRLEHNFDGFNDTQEVIDLARHIIEQGNEGLLLKTPFHFHEYERSKHWFKLKALYLKGSGIEVDLPVVGFHYGRSGTRMEKMLGAFICDFNGVEVRVSGKMTDEQRIAWAKDLPSVIEVNADSITNDGSLRLPIFQRIREDK